jgi:hypothetical protein
MTLEDDRKGQLQRTMRKGGAADTPEDDEKANGCTGGQRESGGSKP